MKHRTYMGYLCNGTLLLVCKYHILCHALRTQCKIVWPTLPLILDLNLPEMHPCLLHPELTKHLLSLGFAINASSWQWEMMALSRSRGTSLKKKSCPLPSPRPPPPPSPPPHPPAPRHPLWWPQHIWNIPKQSRASWAPWKHIWNRSLTSQNNWNTSQTSQNNWRKAAHGVQAVLPQTILINFCQKIWGSLCPL